MAYYIDYLIANTDEEDRPILGFIAETKEQLYEMVDKYSKKLNCSVEYEYIGDEYCSRQEAERELKRFEKIYHDLPEFWPGEVTRNRLEHAKFLFDIKDNQAYRKLGAEDLTPIEHRALIELIRFDRSYRTEKRRVALTRRLKISYSGYWKIERHRMRYFMLKAKERGFSNLTGNEYYDSIIAIMVLSWLDRRKRSPVSKDITPYFKNTAPEDVMFMVEYIRYCVNHTVYEYLKEIAMNFYLFDREYGVTDKISDYGGNWDEETLKLMHMHVKAKNLARETRLKTDPYAWRP